MFFKRKKKEKKVLNYIAVRTSTQSFWEIFRMAAKRCLILLYVQAALLIHWISDVTWINIAGGGGSRGVFDCLKLSKAMKLSGPGAHIFCCLWCFSGGVQLCNWEC